MKITFSKSTLPDTGAVVVGVLAERKFTASAKLLDKKMKGGLVRAIKASRFKGNKDQSLTVMAPASTNLDRVLVIGLGKATEINQLAMLKTGGNIYSNLANARGSATVMVDVIEGSKLAAVEIAAEFAMGARLRSYRFDKYMTKEKKADKPSLKGLKILCDDSSRARAAYANKDKVADGVFFTRDLVSEPSNVLYPETLAEQAKTLQELGVEVEVFGESEMEALGMGALLGVGQGSDRESKMVVMQWKGAPDNPGKEEAPIAFIGKGVTFDTGGISLKPSAGMEDMKWDMGGSGVVIGLMKALAGRKAKINAIGVVGLVENMPSGMAQRPGDIVKSMSGQTIEVLNTDAEGRLVLADVLWYCKDRFKPRFMINLATLTGAIVISLGGERAGLFSNNDILAKRIFDAGEAVGEKVWRMPLGEEYDKMLKSNVADMQNISGGRGAGSITAAQFLQRFVDKTPWAHIDIAGVTSSKKDAPTAPKGGTGFGVRLLDRLIADHYEAD